MNLFDPAFWIAVMGATFIKLALSTSLNFIKAAVTVASALIAAIFFTEPLLHYFGWEPDIYREAVAVLLALTGEEIARLLVNPDKLLAWLKAWRGK
ncbi:hypothetical protein [Roseibium album]|uniref:hypothetical protein n=1 Tax=Roseibium album TaxID=311410 RepID=UPI003BAF957A